MHTSQRQWRAGLGAALVVALAACGSSAAKPQVTAVTTTTLAAVVPVGPNPSVSAKMICAPEGQNAIGVALNESTLKVTTPTWVGHLYSCKYVYATGTLTLSVKELSRASETTAYFEALQHSLGVEDTLDLGGGGFLARNGTVVVRKDYKVLLVDPTALPAQFGKPPTTRSNVATGVANALMGCWTGA